MSKCLNKRCSSEAETRGLCKSCYVIINRYIRQKRITDEGAVAAGKILPKGGKSKSSWFFE